MGRPRHYHLGAYVFAFYIATSITPVISQCSSNNSLTVDESPDYFTSSNYPGNYSSNETCGWTLTATAGYAVEIIISTLTFDQGGGDYYAVYDVNGTSYKLIIQTKAQNSKIKLTSRLNQLFFYFKSDGATEKLGFNVSYRQVAATGLISGYVQNLYYNRSLFFAPDDITWQFYGLTGNIFLAGLYYDRNNKQGCISAITISSGGVNLFSYYGPRDYAYQTIYNDIKVNFKSGSTAVGSTGFQMTFFEQTPPFSRCLGMQSISGTPIGDVQIPPLNVAGFYNRLDNCSWSITVDPGYSISLTLLSTNMPYTLSAISDTLNIFDGPTMQSRLIFRTNASYSTANIVTTSNSALLYFTANSDSNIGSGFLVTYQQVASTSAFYGYIRTISDSITAHYPANQDSGWIASASPDMYIHFAIFSKSLETSYDYLDIFDSDSTPIVRMNGQTPSNFQGQTASPYLSAIFHVDPGVECDGFYLNFTEAILPTNGCTANSSLAVTTSVSNFTSTNYPYNYANNESCGWILTALSGYAVQITISTLTIDQGGGDLYAVYDGNETTNSLVLQANAQRSQIKIVSRSNQIFFRFKSNGATVGKGFIVLYRQASVTGLISGYVQNLNYNRSSISNNEHIVWSLNALPGNVFLLGVNIARSNLVDCVRPLKIMSGTYTLYNSNNGLRDHAFQTPNNTATMTYGSTCAWPGASTGVRITFAETTSPIPTCSGLIQSVTSSTTGNLQIPPLNTAGFYNRLDNCSWAITVTPGYSISLTLVSKIMPYNQSGSLVTPPDTLYIYDGPDKQSRLIFQTNASYSTSRIVTTSNSAFLTFIANSDMSVGTGYFVTYQQVSYTSAFYGYIQTSLDSITAHYPSYQDSWWTITTRPGLNITYAVIQKALEKNLDYVDIFHGVLTGSPPLYRISVQGNFNFTNQTNTSSLSLIFRSDSYTEFDGWLLNFNENAPICDTAHPCLNGATCTAPNNCTCTPLWTGGNCSIPVCFNPVCNNEGTCVRPNVCNCTSNWTGIDCSIPTCLNNPCLYGNCSAPDTCTCWWSNFTGPSCSAPVCSPICINGGNCTSPNVCACASGWTGSTCETAICSSGCGNGNCTSPEVCTCSTGWTGSLCDTAICSSPCANGNCTAPNTCTCESGWTGSLCETGICDGGCLNSGNCTATNVCTCDASWNGTNCEIPICTTLCLNGNCTAPNTCTCASGWAGSSCETPICFGGCGNGNCSSPDVCICYSGWTGSTCDSAICIHQCINGNCTSPNLCSCAAGWNGTCCEIPICNTPCANNGNCTAPNTCTCAEGWTGPACVTAICDGTCLNSGNCSAPNVCTCAAGWNGTYCETPICNAICVNGNCTAPNTCTCMSGWTGSTCQTAICNSGCGNGNCTSPGICSCLTGWTGSTCDSAICIDQCMNGNCTAPNSCTCSTGWNGTYCEAPICNANCVNGNCTEPNTCTCASGWTGPTCQSAICNSGCGNGNCTSPGICICTVGWTGSTCNSAICSPQCSNGNCSAPGNCTCLSGWTGTICDSAVCSPHCVNGNCTAPNTCICASDWTGSLCETPICVGVCLNGGNCTSPNKCTCLTGWNGTFCEMPVCNANCVNGNCTAPNTCNCASGWTGPICQTAICNSGCGNGNCTSPGICTCSAGWTGSTCNSPICSPQCINGNCTAPGICTCTSGWSGTNCESAICSGGCLNGNCTNLNVCTCSPGWTGNNCNSPTCSQACSTNGNCTAPNICSCSTGWTGSTCSTPLCTNSCSNGNCTSPNICTCNAGWAGANCSTPICQHICANNGTCISPNACSCSSGWTGYNCSQPVCPSGCGHGSCISPAACQCQIGWTGANCSIAICSQTCSHGGTCVAPDICYCATGWTGYACTNATCSPPCQNGATCSSPNTCSCASGYTGATCHFSICSTACLNGGNCSSPNVCSCSNGWSGTVCETPICNPGCVNGGNCSAPNICLCTANWTGPSCSEPVCNPSCLNGGTCSSPNNCTCPSGANGTICENTLCNPLCKNGGTCIGNNLCQCGYGWSGGLCETLVSGVSALAGVSHIPDAVFINNIDTVKSAVESAQQGTIPIGTNLTTQEIKAIISDVTSPDKIANLVTEIISNPFFDPPVQVFSNEQLDQQSEVLSTLNQVTQRMLQLAGSLSTEQLTSLTGVLAKAADKAATLAVQGALAVQSAIMKSDRLTEKPKLSCTPLITEKERSSLKEALTIAKLDNLNNNFGDFIDGLIMATFYSPLQIGESKVISGDFYSVTIKKATLGGLSELSLHSNLGGIDFPYFETSQADFVVFKQSSSTSANLKLSTAVLLVLTTYVSNVMNSTSPYNFPTVTVRLFTAAGVELEWASAKPLQITSQPPDSYRKQYSIEKTQSQCNPHKVQCDVTTNADALGSLATFPLPTNAGDFFVDISGDQTIPYDVFISFNRIPSPTKYTWAISVASSQYITRGNTSSQTLRVTYDASGKLQAIIPQKVISAISGQPVTRVIDATPPLIVYLLIKRNFATFTKVDDLPDSACENLKCEGFNLRINRMEPTRYYRRKRQASAEYQIEDLELDTNSSNMVISFRAKSFGTFTSDLLIVPNTIEFTDVIENFDSLVVNNWIVIATLAATLCIFLTILIPMHIFDKADLKEWAFLPITSNSTHEKMQYLISVHCNGCRNYQLTPKVDVRLFGDVTSTQWRWLDDGKRKNFITGRPSNFILTTYHSIGTIGKIEISVTGESSHENDDKCLELEIDRVIVIDVAKGRKYVFPCRSKLGDTKQTKAFKLPTEDELKCFDYLLAKNYHQLLSDAHLWRSIFRRPIPSNFTRCERIACIFVALHLAMLSSAMFFGKEPSSSRTGLNVGGIFRISWFTFVTSLISCCIVVPPTSLLAFIFQSVKRHAAENSEWESTFTRKSENPDDDDHETDAKSSKANKATFSMPRWCLYVGWSVAGMCIATSIFLAMFYSLQWGQDKSLQWLSGLFIELLQDLIFIQTAKVMVIAVFRAGRLTLPDDGLDIGKLTFAKDNSTRRVSLFRKLRAIATGLGHHAVYVIAFAMVISATTNPYAYNQVKSLKPHLFVKGLNPVNETVLNHSVIFDHLLFRIIPNFLNGNQVKYGLNFDNADFYKVPNHDVVIIGPIRVRQMRAGSATCPILSPVAPEFTGRYSIPLANNTYCSKLPQGFDVFGDIFERRNFNCSWSLPIDWIDMSSNLTEFQEAWLYRETNGPSYIGELDTYGSFGYYVDLPTKLKNALRVVAQLRITRWLDNNTIAVFTDFNLYNPQTNVFSVIKIVFESLTTGGMIYQARRYPLKLYQYTGSGALFTIIVQAVWIVLLVSQIVKLVFQIRKEGFKKFRNNQWNFLNLVNLTVGVVIVGFFSARIYVTNTVLESLLNPDQFTSLDALSAWEELTFGLYGLGFFLAMMGFFQYLETNKYWAIVLATFSKGKMDMLSFSFFYIAITAIFAGFLYLLVGPVMYGFSTYKKAFTSLFQRTIGFPEMTRLGFPDKFSMLCSMMYSGTVLLLGGQVFIIIITAIYGQISRNAETETDWDAELAEYLGQEWRRVTSHHTEEDCEEKGEKQSTDFFGVKPVGEKTFKKFEEMLSRFSGLIEKLGLDIEDIDTSKRKPTMHDKVRKNKDKIPQTTLINVKEVPDAAENNKKMNKKVNKKKQCMKDVGMAESEGIDNQANEVITEESIGQGRKNSDLSVRSLVNEEEPAESKIGGGTGKNKIKIKKSKIRKPIKKDINQIETDKDDPSDAPNPNKLKSKKAKSRKTMRKAADDKQADDQTTPSDTSSIRSSYFNQLARTRSEPVKPIPDESTFLAGRSSYFQRRASVMALPKDQLLPVHWEEH